MIRSDGKFRLLIISVLLLWLALGVFLIVFWSSLPAYLSWPLSILEILIGADGRMFRIALGREKIEARNDGQKEGA